MKYNTHQKRKSRKRTAASRLNEGSNSRGMDEVNAENSAGSSHHVQMPPVKRLATARKKGVASVTKGSMRKIGKVDVQLVAEFLKDIRS